MTLEYRIQNLIGIILFLGALFVSFSPLVGINVLPVSSTWYDNNETPGAYYGQ